MDARREGGRRRGERATRTSTLGGSFGSSARTWPSYRSVSENVSGWRPMRKKDVMATTANARRRALRRIYGTDAAPALTSSAFLVARSRGGELEDRLVRPRRPRVPTGERLLEWRAMGEGEAGAPRRKPGRHSGPIILVHSPRPAQCQRDCIVPRGARRDDPRVVVRRSGSHQTQRRKISRRGRRAVVTLSNARGAPRATTVPGSPFATNDGLPRGGREAPCVRLPPRAPATPSRAPARSRATSRPTSER